MFTGIVEELGKVTNISRRRGGLLLEVKTQKIGETSEEGDSISLNGVCLTVMEKKGNSLLFYLSEETLRMSNLRELRIGDEVNLERALTLEKGLGGHILQGHVDGIGYIKRIVKRGEEWSIRIAVDRKLMPYIVPKGSVGVEGISLTVARVYPDGFEVVIIPYTLEKTNLKNKRVGSRVNIETDIMAKYAFQAQSHGGRGYNPA